jgi:IS5 family transposase
MMKQQTLTGFERYAKTTRRAQFLADMQVIVPWAELTAVVEPFYPKIGEAGGRPPLPLERMLRVYFLQLWFNLSDPAVEEALYESASMRNFAGIDLGVEAAPDETTVCKFRHLLEKKILREQLTQKNRFAEKPGRHHPLTERRSKPSRPFHDSFAVVFRHLAAVSRRRGGRDRFLDVNQTIIVMFSMFAPQSQQYGITQPA